MTYKHQSADQRSAEVDEDTRSIQKPDIEKNLNVILIKENMKKPTNAVIQVFSRAVSKFSPFSLSSMLLITQ